MNITHPSFFIVFVNNLRIIFSYGTLFIVLYVVQLLLITYWLDYIDLATNQERLVTKSSKLLQSESLEIFFYHRWSVVPLLINAHSWFKEWLVVPCQAYGVIRAGIEWRPCQFIYIQRFQHVFLTFKNIKC